MFYLGFFILGLIIGGLIVYFIFYFKKQDAHKIAQQIIAQAEEKKNQELELIINRIKESFGSLSLEALSRNTDQFLKLANETLSRQTQSSVKELEEKRQLIDKTLETMKSDLQRLQNVVTEFDKDRKLQFGQLVNQLRFAVEQTEKLQITTSQLKTALARREARGQWGERMAEDVLRFAGFIEGINYLKQKRLENIGTKPDYTFLLPKNLRVNMDVKFPLDNYMNYLEAQTESDRENFKKRFLKDVKDRIKEVTGRDYINPEQNTVDYVLVFIPNEQVYTFINECDSSILDEALRNKVILCSPITLYAILAIIRQAIDNFHLEKRAAEMLVLFGNFYKQWNRFKESLEKMGKKIEEAQKEYISLTTTITHQLEKPLKKIDQLREGQNIIETPLSEEIEYNERSNNSE